MPTDLEPSPIITVVDRSETNLPFSKGIMATSILATGVDTLTAHRLAKSIERELIARNLRSIGADDLAQLAATTIEAHAGTDVADRYTRWRRAKRTGRPFVVVLSGAPGVGKSTLATRLAVRLGVDRVVASDAIREVLRTVIPAAVLPELHVSTFEAVGARRHECDLRWRPPAARGHPYRARPPWSRRLSRRVPVDTR
jgi:2-phosphoglycerate kinase